VNLDIKLKECNYEDLDKKVIVDWAKEEGEMEGISAATNISV